MLHTFSLLVLYHSFVSYTEGPDACAKEQQDYHPDVLPDRLDRVEVDQFPEAVAVVTVPGNSQDSEEYGEATEHRHAAPEGKFGPEIGDQQDSEGVLSRNHQPGEEV